VRFAPGSRVRARLLDPDHHTRLPGYARGQLGVIVEGKGVFPLPDDRARGIAPPRVEMVYAVRFPAAALWGTGTHTVTVELWESYLEEAG
jgi:nitrile hydratase subunit beta